MMLPYRSTFKVEGQCKRDLPVDERILPRAVRDVKLNGTGSVCAMFLHKRIESVLTAADDDDVAAFFHEFLCQAKSDSRGGANDDYLLVLEHHGNGL